MGVVRRVAAAVRERPGWSLLTVAAALFCLGWVSLAMQVTTDPDPQRGPAGPWTVVAVAALVTVWAGLRVLRPRPPRPSAGWHDDPDDPTKLRYHDGARWTQRTADKR